MKKIFYVCLIFLIFSTKISFATEEILESQKQDLGVNDFIKEAQKYSKDSLGDLQISEILEEAIKREY